MNTRILTLTVGERVDISGDTFTVGELINLGETLIKFVKDRELTIKPKETGDQDEKND